VNLESLLYAKTHEWTSVATGPDGRKIATVGLTAFALEALTDLVFIDLPPVGRAAARGRRFGEVESVKAVSDLYSPVDGEIVEVNADAAGRLDKLAEDPYDAGWLVKIRIADETGLADLMDYEAYQRQCEEEVQE
jgi:glycine cleavage system H protein